MFTTQLLLNYNSKSVITMCDDIISDVTNFTIRGPKKIKKL